mmetsp:Transcript_18176/g.50457  ORF Transcript_18176/g.50457 Transcript_18176/m.50457 type:complete len:276 (-) Transcript_18176:331-1158(-)|eukprot:CAMPEP_0198113946 /NCGR_PEP_ID=MMETSP1442-20131203/5482_1 /TAXON_ID= /ORGANISM="Craspedostauros australis, Strain CCMP3328" /LENGTH=275 /DNA_ID=CAMNT_0043771155 /DNA_START=314 /DNA_END=1141 /DNA_ORIENTATION=+
MSITYEEALATLEAMFGDPWTKETLDAVLRHEKGHMENTCERILNHGSRNPKILIDQLKSGAENPQVSIDAELARQLNQRENKGRSQGSKALEGKPRKGKPTTLPPGFLRVPGYKYAADTTASNAAAAAGKIDDETLARMLQDELFSEELARNPDFAHLARGRNASARSSSRAGRGAAGSRTSFPAARRSATSNATVTSNAEERPKIFGKISELGDNARKRLALFASQFEQRLNARNVPAGANATRSPGDAVAERRGLLDDEFEDTIEFETRKNQ